MSAPNNESCCGIYRIIETYVLSDWQSIPATPDTPPGRQRELKEKCQCLACGRVWLRHIVQQESDDSTSADWWKQ